MASRLRFSGDAFHADFNDPSLAGTTCRRMSVEALLPEAGKLLNRFRHWVKSVFGGPMELFAACDVKGDGRVTHDMLQKVCNTGFEASPREWFELFSCCDVDAMGSVTSDEICFLETDDDIRDVLILRVRMKSRDKREREMASVFYREQLKEQTGELPATHRLASRPWLAEHFEKLPTLVNHRRIERLQKERQKNLQDRATFLRFVRERFGHEVRCWRQALDPDGTFEVTEQEFRRFCRSSELDIDVASLWRSLDRDSDGIFRLEEMAPRCADTLSSFKRWARQASGSCVGIWRLPQTLTAAQKSQENAGRWASDKKLRLSAFAAVLRDLGWEGLGNPDSRAAVFQSLDIHGCGFIAVTDLEWLDFWHPPDWMCSHADHSAWEDLRNLMLRAYGHPLKAWRVLDSDNSNQVSWGEFREVAENLHFRGNLAGAWRTLDYDYSGTMSLAEFDPPSFELLFSFKEWAEKNFGSVRLAFKALDDDGSGHLSFHEVNRAAKKLQWSGDVKLLFKCLEIPMIGQEHHRLYLKDIAFLDSWEVDDPGLDANAEVERLAVEAQRTSQLRSSQGSRQGMRFAPKPGGGGGSPPSSPAAVCKPKLLMETPSGTASAPNSRPSTRAAEAVQTGPTWERVGKSYHCLRSASTGALDARQRRRKSASGLPWFDKILSIDAQAQGTKRRSRSNVQTVMRAVDL